jgi:hypothetical protein
MAERFRQLFSMTNSSSPVTQPSNAPPPHAHQQPTPIAIPLPLPVYVPNTQQTTPTATMPLQPNSNPYEPPVFTYQMPSSASLSSSPTYRSTPAPHNTPSTSTSSSSSAYHSTPAHLDTPPSPLFQPPTSTTSTTTSPAPSPAPSMPTQPPTGSNRFVIRQDGKVVPTATPWLVDLIVRLSELEEAKNAAHKPAPPVTTAPTAQSSSTSGSASGNATPTSVPSDNASAPVEHKTSINSSYDDTPHASTAALASRVSSAILDNFSGLKTVRAVVSETGQHLNNVMNVISNAKIFHPSIVQKSVAAPVTDSAAIVPREMTFSEQEYTRFLERMGCAPEVCRYIDTYVAASSMSSMPTDPNALVIETG